MNTTSASYPSTCLFPSISSPTLSRESPPFYLPRPISISTIGWPDPLFLSCHVDCWLFLPSLSVASAINLILFMTVRILATSFRIAEFSFISRAGLENFSVLLRVEWIGADWAVYLCFSFRGLWATGFCRMFGVSEPRLWELIAWLTLSFGCWF